jgi:hypothetical protein
VRAASTVFKKSRVATMRRRRAVLTSIAVTRIRALVTELVFYVDEPVHAIDTIKEPVHVHTPLVPRSVDDQITIFTVKKLSTEIAVLAVRGDKVPSRNDLAELFELVEERATEIKVFSERLCIPGVAVPLV